MKQLLGKIEFWEILFICLAILSFCFLEFAFITLPITAIAAIVASFFAVKTKNHYIPFINLCVLVGIGMVYFILL